MSIDACEVRRVRRGSSAQSVGRGPGSRRRCSIGLYSPECMHLGGCEVQRVYRGAMLQVSAADPVGVAAVS